MESKTIKKNALGVLTAGVIGTVGLAVAGFAAMWVAGTLGISTAAASQIVAAIEVGGWALAVIMTVFGAGVIGAIVATVRGMIGRLGTAYAVA